MLFLITLALAVITTALTGVITGRWLTLASLYWLGWLLGIPAALLAGAVDLVPQITPYGEQVILTTHYGAALGFVLAALLSVRARAITPMPRLTHSGAVWVIVGLQAALGLALLASRIGSAGLDLFAIRTDYLADAYLTDNLPPQYRLYNYVALIALVPSILIATRDRSLGRISWVSLGLLFLAAAPGGISTGGRVWLVQTVAAYFISYALASGPRLRVAEGAKRLGQVLAAVLALGALFTLFGNVRDTSRGQGQIHPPSSMPVWIADQVQTYSPLISYLGVPTAAAGAYAQFNESAFGGTRMQGQQTFPFVYSQLTRFGLGDDTNLSRDYTAAQRDWVSATVDRRIGTTHATLAPLLVADFGERNLLLSAFLVFFVMQFGFLWAAAYGGVWHVFATVLAMYGGLLIFQDASFGTASAFIPLIAALVLIIPLRKNLYWGKLPLTAAR